ncbi:hypothetical protein MHAS_00048 [Mycolicibacterium hassiacum DSM 44199]|jgi:hypothetical protein|uniref:HNH endonuclease signature motif containing protein n=1 Tax=Mycolicibacterium hassiacum TaxID=46351 RepID=UPI00035D1B3A|nr:HNH endonuclease signature motif containing protein [Mycolicibacterium hassiacum]MBX5486355.1 DUF222 domain-containing protein [Mycolicibacterium hassiacum]MDA4087997.1 hypothetical protein [Mycolicibacterium hassiacum DSM 44199]VCT88368.1 hypothetical protein MHAS_00048 [Mycolicibacterium hassiacum DSM 44199]
MAVAAPVDDDLDQPVESVSQRLDRLIDDLAELSGQLNAIHGRIVECIAQISRDGSWAYTGARSLAGFVAWKLGMSTTTAKVVSAIAERFDEFPKCIERLQQGQLSLDQVGVIAQHAGPGSDEHYLVLAESATVNQLRFALKLEPKPDKPRPEPKRKFVRHVDGDWATYTIVLPIIEAAKLDTAVAAHHEALVNEYKRDHGPEAADDSDRDDADTAERPPFPNLTDAFMRMVDEAWDAEITRRPHSQHTTVLVHLDIDKQTGWLHRGPLLSDADRKFLLCDATCEVWLERRGQPIGSGRTSRVISRRLRRALEQRHPTCAVPGCNATRGLHAHHIEHWEDGGPTELFNLVLLCPHHHRAHHRGEITISGTADRLVVKDYQGRPIEPGSVARKPNQPPPAVPPWRGPLGERADWWWYDPFEPQPPPSPN